MSIDTIDYFALLLISPVLVPIVWALFVVSVVSRDSIYADGPAAIRTIGTPHFCAVFFGW
jgi:hypothetical protein